MLYRELVQFEPLDTIIQLRESADLGEARRLVKTYAFSDRMVEQLSGLVFPQLQMARGVDNKGIFIVGNYRRCSRNSRGTARACQPVRG